MLRSPEWSPAWVREKRTLKFVDNDVPPPGRPSIFGIGFNLWGNIAAIDIINASNNEGVADIRNRDLSMAFLASGDFRNVIRTINELPEDYAGTIKIVLNDFNPIVVCRNFIILSILGIVEDVEEAAEHALHLWYSIFQPLFYETRVLFPVIESQILQHLDGTSAQLTPSTTIFDEMFNAGKAHGTTEEDLIGCLFFYVKDQLVEFSKRLRKFKIQVYSFDQNTRELPKSLKIYPTFLQSFDRVDVSNITDKSYIGMSILSDWGPLLNKAKSHAAIIGILHELAPLKKNPQTTCRPRGFLQLLFSLWTGSNALQSWVQGIVKYIDSPERWYKVASLSDMTYYERYVEWGQVGNLGKYLRKG
ncbi:hypothetical protein DFS33DRAFT_1434619 [Desarmillaria ectypa]|nr:hypothetical protein DFS33DRAFT_1434619 [Desarmillaria ectypa]